MGSKDQAPRKVYPRVKVREQVDPKSFQVTTDILLKVVESLSREGRHPSSICTSKHGNPKSFSPTSRSAISSPLHSSLLSPSASNGSEGRNKEVNDQDKKQTVKASSVPRPRAVLSSPSNDNIIGQQNQISREKKKGEEAYMSAQKARGSQAAQNKATPRISIRVQSPVNKKEAGKVPTNNSSPMRKATRGHEKTSHQLAEGQRKPNPDWVL